MAATTGTLLAPPATDEHVVIAPLVRLVLDVRLVILFVGALGLSVADQAFPAVLLLVLMAATSAAPVLAWRAVGGWIVRHPLAVSVDLAVALGVLLAGGGGSVLGVGYVVTTAVLIGALYGRWGGLVLALPLVAACGVIALDGDLTGAVTASVLVLVGARVGGDLRRLFLALDAARLEARVLAREAAVAGERERLARELHDSVAKTLVGIGMTATALRQGVEDDTTAARLADQIDQASQQAVRETRSLVHGLRIDDVSLPLEASIREIAATFARFNDITVDVHSDVTDDVPVDDAQRYEVVQILREALRNVAQHARANRVRIDLAASAEQGLRLEVHDDGVGVPDDRIDRPGHYGLRGMGERARTVGGHLDVTGGRDGGTSVVLEVPAQEVRA